MPTEAPTKVLSRAPNQAPTKVPTKAPTKAITKAPTKVFVHLSFDKTLHGRLAPTEAKKVQEKVWKRVRRVVQIEV